MLKNLVIVCALGIMASVATAQIQTVPVVDGARFVGTWYRIASNPIIVEPACACARQVLTPAPGGDVEVYNSCNKKVVSGPLVEIRGVAKSDGGSSSKLKVYFNGIPWGGQYWILAVADDYSWAVVSDGKGRSLYIMSKAPTLSDALYAKAVAAAQAQGVSTKKLERQVQQGCSYPSAK